MIKVRPVSRNPWFPGATTGEAAPPSRRSVEIAKSQEALLELLRDVPEQELELSLTDLVQVGASIDEDSTPSVSDEAAKSNQEQRSSSAKKRKKEMSSEKRRFRSRSDGVLLRLYVPASLTRSRTAPAGTRPRGFICRDDCNFDGENEVTSLGCWSALWNRRTKSRRQMP